MTRIGLSAFQGSVVGPIALARGSEAVAPLLPGDGSADGGVWVGRE